MFITIVFVIIYLLAWAILAGNTDVEIGNRKYYCKNWKLAREQFITLHLIFAPAIYWLFADKSIWPLVYSAAILTWWLYRRDSFIM